MRLRLLRWAVAFSAAVLGACAAIAAGWLLGMLIVPLPSTMSFVSCATLARNIRHEVTFSARSVTCSPTKASA